MYRIQGSDQKEYGPIALETIRQWIGERRLNRESLACAESEGVWKPLGQFPEFADLLATAAVPYPNPAYPTTNPAEARSRALSAVKAPGIMLLILALASLLACIGMGIMGLSGNDFGQLMMKSMGFPIPQPSPEQQAIQQKITRIQGLALVTIGPIYNLIGAIGAFRMMKLRSRGLALSSAILAVIPCFSVCCLITLPIGIWALVVLAKPEVKSQFT